jgi:hypothetical protein
MTTVCADCIKCGCKKGLGVETVKAVLDAEWNSAIEAAANALRDGRSQFAVRQLKRKVRE